MALERRTGGQACADAGKLGIFSSFETVAVLIDHRFVHFSAILTVQPLAGDVYCER